MEIYQEQKLIISVPFSYLKGGVRDRIKSVRSLLYILQYMILHV